MTILFHGARKLDAGGEVEDFWMLVTGDTIVATGSGPAPAAPVPVGGASDAHTTVNVGGQWLVPGFIDLHSHGGGGHAYDDGPEAIGSALATHRAHGTTRSVISLVANPLASMRESLAIIAELAETDPLILGSHLEGPFLAPDNRGAHNPDFLIEPREHEIEELLSASRGTVRHVTIAPELPGGLEAIDVFVEAGVVVAIGHTRADERLAREAFDRGARILTHAFNAMPGIHHRDPGPIVAAFEDERVTLELILDGKHVHPAVARIAFTSAPGRIALVTDAMAAAGSVDGDYTLGSLNVAVRDGLAMLRGTTTIAGSTLTQDSAFRIAMRDAHIAPIDAITALTLTPARALGLDHRYGMLAAGYVADAVLLDHAFAVQRVWADGRAL